ncbi:hypothetical protein F2P81_001724 [Scophthalmus maximus]|uniref:Uncharacterized protein n=1 Tax=Scophthalmus maximus TaxID=52904 RepID=A0A6A4TJ08_SCOMX|nr:hypothetical protein F2P81_001724 [Scophthalmus maximus]
MMRLSEGEPDTQGEREEEEEEEEGENQTARTLIPSSGTVKGLYTGGATSKSEKGKGTRIRFIGLWVRAVVKHADWCWRFNFRTATLSLQKHRKYQRCYSHVPRTNGGCQKRQQTTSVLLVVPRWYYCLVTVIKTLQYLDTAESSFKYEHSLFCKGHSFTCHTVWMQDSSFSAQSSQTDEYLYKPCLFKNMTSHDLYTPSLLMEICIKTLQAADPKPPQTVATWCLEFVPVMAATLEPMVGAHTGIHFGNRRSAYSHPNHGEATQQSPPRPLPRGSDATGASSQCLTVLHRLVLRHAAARGDVPTSSRCIT